MSSTQLCPLLNKRAGEAITVSEQRTWEKEMARGKCGKGTANRPCKTLQASNEGTGIYLKQSIKEF